jgi:hypothetical protein
MPILHLRIQTTRNMKISTTIAQVLLGVPFLIFGANYFFPFVPHPQLHGAAHCCPVKLKIISELR